MGLPRWLRGWQKIQDRAKYLEDTIEQSDEAKELVEHPGWSNVEAILEHYRAMALREFRDGKRSQERYRADLDATDAILEGVRHLVTLGDEARDELAKIQPILERRAAKIRAAQRA